MIKALIFDFDYTLTDRSISLYYGLSRIADKHFPDLDWMEKEAVVQRMIILDEFGTVSRSHTIDYMVEHYKLDRDELTKDFSTLSMDMAPKTKLDDEVIPLLETLKKNYDYKLAILTNGNTESQLYKIDTTHIHHFFDYIAVSEESGYWKPDKRAFEYIATKLGVKCEECLYIGDTFFTDIIGAYRSNMHYLLLNNDRKRHYDERIPQIQHLSEVIDYLKNYE